MSYSTDIDAKTATALREHIERLESLAAERKQAGEKFAAELKTAAASGFDAKAIRQLLKERKGDLHKSIGHRAVVETYRDALAKSPGTELGDWARSWSAQTALHRRRETEERYNSIGDMISRHKARPADGAGDQPTPPAQ